jgi:hypothetical protein
LKTGKVQKLSKIETLRLARNYIMALTEILRYNHSINTLTLGQFLCTGLSQPTVNAIAFQLDIHPRLLSRPNPTTNAIIQLYNTFSTASLTEFKNLSENFCFANYSQLIEDQFSPNNFDNNLININDTNDSNQLNKF